MRKYKIITDSTTDLPKDYLRQNDLEIIPICYSFEGEVFGVEKELPSKEFFEKMRSGLMPTTMAANPQMIEEILRRYLDDGFDVLYIVFSSGLSGSYNSAAMVGERLKEEYKDAKIYVIDSLCASLGEGLIVHKALKLQQEGKTIDEVATWVRENKLNICHQFTVDDLFHLHRGGRVSKAAAIVGTIINVKPILHVDNEGKLVPQDKVRGRKRALTALVDNMGKNMGSFQEKNDIVFISHGDCEEDANFVANLVKERFAVKDVFVSILGPTIGAHTGPGLVALFFMGDVR